MDSQNVDPLKQDPKESKVILFEEAVRTLPRIGRRLTEGGATASEKLIPECQKLVDTCQVLFGAEVCALHLIRGGYAVLEAHIGYEHPHGTPIEFPRLRDGLRYRVD